MAGELLGRDALVARSVRRIVEDGERLLVFVGRHGVGKTSVALTVANRLAGPHHVVDLRDAIAEAECLVRLAGAAGVIEVNRPAVAATLAADHGVIVLDGGDVDVVGPFVRWLLEAVDHVTIVATGAEPLGLPDERVIHVSPLPLPPPDEVDPAVIAGSPAVQLFLQRADRAAPTFEPGDEDLRTIAEVCRRLDGLPEALVLAASRMGIMAPQAMLQEMSRLGAWELVGLSVDEELERSVALLDDQVREVLLALATSTGGSSMDALAAVADVDDVAVVADALSLLVRLQLATADPVRARYGLTSSAARFVGRHLGDGAGQPGRRARHAAHHAAAARAFGRRPHGAPMEPAWLLDHGNRLRALAWLRATGDRAGALRLVVDSMPGFVHRGEPDAGRHLLAEVLHETTETPSGSCIQAHMWLARLEAERADGIEPVAARRHFDTALRLARQRGDPVIHLEVLNCVAENHVLLADGLQQSEAAVAEAFELCAAPGLEIGRAVFLCWHTGNLHRRGHDDEAAAAISEALDMARFLGDRLLLMSFGIMHWQLPRGVRREMDVPSVDELLEMATDQGDLRTKGWVLIVATGNAIDDGDERRALAHATEMAELARRTQQRPLARQVLLAAARWSASRGAHDDVARAAGVLASHRGAIDISVNLPWIEDLDRGVAAARSALGRGFDVAYDLGRTDELWAATAAAEERFRRRLAELDAIPAAGTAPVDPLACLTPRETEVLAALADGLPNKEIAARLGMRPKTVAHHCAVIYDKLGVRNRTEAAAEALRRHRPVASETPVT